MIIKYTRKELFNRAGIYKIYSLLNERVYIGSACNLYRRLNAHNNNLKNNVHTNSKLKSFANKYGQDSLIAEVIEFCSCESGVLEQRETFYIKKYNSIINGFNIAIPYRPPQNLHLTDEHKKRISDTHLKNMVKLRPILEANLIKARISRAEKIKTGELKLNQDKIGTKASKETRAKLSAAKTGKHKKMTPEKWKIYAQRQRAVKSGEKSHLAKLTEANVIAIKALLLQGIQQKIIAKRYNMSNSTITDIKTGRSWAYL